MLESATVNPKYIFAVKQSDITEGSYTPATMPGYTAGWYGLLVDPYFLLSDDYSVLDRQTPLAPGASLSRSLLWMSGNGMRHDAVLEMYMRQQGAQHAEITPVVGIRLDSEKVIRSSAQGVIYPRVMTKRYEQYGVLSYTMAELLQQNSCEATAA